MTTETQTTEAPSSTENPSTDAAQPPAQDTTSSTTAPSPEGSVLDPGKSADETTDTATEKTADEIAADAARAELFGAPEGDYAPTLPEGTTLDADALAAIAPVAKELGLSDAGFNKLLAPYMETVLPRLQEQFSSNINTQVAELRTAWATDARASVEGGKTAAGEDATPDPVFAGAKLPAVQATAARALDRFGGEGFREFLAENGLGNHPQMLRFAYQAGALISEDTSIDRGAGVPAVAKTREEKYYGTPQG